VGPTNQHTFQIPLHSASTTALFFNAVSEMKTKKINQKNKQKNLQKVRLTTRIKE